MTFSILLLIYGLIIVFSSIGLMYYIYHLVLMDAKSRKLEQAKFWSVIASSSQNGGGLLLYLFKRRNTSNLLSAGENKRFLTIKRKIYCLMALDLLAFLMSLAALIRL